MEKEVWGWIMNHYRTNIQIYTAVTPEVARLYEEVYPRDLTKLLRDRFPDGFRVRFIVPKVGHIALDTIKHGSRTITLFELGYKEIDGRYVLRK